MATRALTTRRMSDHVTGNPPSRGNVLELALQWTGRVY